MASVTELLDRSFLRSLVRRFRPQGIPAAAKVDALRALAGLVRAGAPLRTALIEWPAAASEDVRGHLEGTARRSRLGAPLPDALAASRGFLGSDLDALVAAVRLHFECGTDAASMIEAVAGDIDRREVGSGNARAQAAGARLSARLIGGLPLAFLPLMPPGKASLWDPVGLTLVVTGLALAVGGMRWLGRLLPDPPAEDDRGASLASALARCLEAGGDVGQGLVAVARRGAGSAPPDDSLDRAARRVRLGLPARRALLLSDDEGLRAVGRCLELAHQSGAPPARSLVALAEARRAEQQRRFEEEMRRAPVKMVVPLTLCVLPSFALLGLAPFLRGVTFSA